MFIVEGTPPSFKYEHNLGIYVPCSVVKTQPFGFACLRRELISTILEEVESSLEPHFVEQDAQLNALRFCIVSYFT